jgi:hypothetical protein
MLMKRLLPPLNVAMQTQSPNGRRYSAAPGTVLDVFPPDADMLAANGWTHVSLVGSTADRPKGTGGLNLNDARPGVHFYDTDIAAMLVFDGANWRNVATGDAA